MLSNSMHKNILPKNSIINISFAFFNLISNLKIVLQKPYGFNSILIFSITQSTNKDIFDSVINIHL